VLGQILFEEDPGAADLGSGDFPGLGTTTEFLRMAAQERSSFLDIERPHNDIPAGVASTALTEDSHDADSPTATRAKHPSPLENLELVMAQDSEGDTRHSTLDRRFERGHVLCAQHAMRVMQPHRRDREAQPFHILWRWCLRPLCVKRSEVGGRSTPGLEVIGYTLAREIQKLAPATRVLLTTGFDRDMVDVNASGSLEFEIINKPYGLSDLARRIRIMLDGPAGSIRDARRPSIT
jgi:hypothetical protein